MRFCHPFIPTANARDAEQALARHQRARAKASVQCDQPPFIVLFPRAIFSSTDRASHRVPEEFDRISVWTYFLPA
jgi:hypothetical protein